MSYRSSAKTPPKTVVVDEGPRGIAYGVAAIGVVALDNIQGVEVEVTSIRGAPAYGVRIRTRDGRTQRLDSNPSALSRAHQRIADEITQFLRNAGWRGP